MRVGTFIKKSYMLSVKFHTQVYLLIRFYVWKMNHFKLLDKIFFLHIFKLNNKKSYKNKLCSLKCSIDTCGSYYTLLELG